eukprot:9396332-Prorocentrum_lima.AAC.1
MGQSSHNSKTDLTQIAGSQNYNTKRHHQMDISTCTTYGKTRRRKTGLLQPTKKDDCKTPKRQDSSTRRLQCR